MLVTLLSVNYTFRPVNFFDPEFLVATDQQGVFLSGLPLPPDTLPPIPFTTIAPPPTTPQATCGQRLEFSTSDIGVRFGDSNEGYVAFDATENADIFRSE